MANRSMVMAILYHLWWFSLPQLFLFGKSFPGSSRYWAFSVHDVYWPFSLLGYLLVFAIYAVVTLPICRNAAQKEVSLFSQVCAHLEYDSCRLVGLVVCTGLFAMPIHGFGYCLLYAYLNVAYSVAPSPDVYFTWSSGFVGTGIGTLVINTGIVLYFACSRCCARAKKSATAYYVAYDLIYR